MAEDPGPLDEGVGELENDLLTGGPEVAVEARSTTRHKGPKLRPQPAAAAPDTVLAEPGAGVDPRLAAYHQGAVPALPAPPASRGRSELTTWMLAAAFGATVAYVASSLRAGPVAPLEAERLSAASALAREAESLFHAAQAATDSIRRGPGLADSSSAPVSAWSETPGSLELPTRVRTAALAGSTLEVPSAARRAEQEPGQRSAPVAHASTLERSGSDRVDVTRPVEQAALLVQEPGVPRDAIEQASLEQATVEQAQVAQPTAEQPTAEQPTAEQATVAQATAEQASVAQATAEQATVAQPTVEQPTAELGAPADSVPLPAGSPRSEPGVALPASFGAVPGLIAGRFLDPGPLVAAGGEDWPATLVHARTGIEFVLVPGGSFTLGDDTSPSPDERPAVSVQVSAFYMARTEVSVDSWGAGGGAAAQPAGHPGGAHPVVAISWHEARAWCDRNGLALPSEAQWEYAAAGPEERRYPWGDEWRAGAANLAVSGGGHGQTAPVGTYPEDESWCGVLDLAGNVSEWCADLFARDHSWIEPGECDPLHEREGEDHVERGGSYRDDSPVRSTYRFGFSADGLEELGFRPVWVP